MPWRKIRWCDWKSSNLGTKNFFKCRFKNVERKKKKFSGRLLSLFHQSCAGTWSGIRSEGFQPTKKINKNCCWYRKPGGVSVPQEVMASVLETLMSGGCGRGYNKKAIKLRTLSTTAAKIQFCTAVFPHLPRDMISPSCHVRRHPGCILV